MAPKKQPYQCPLLLSTDDVKSIREMAVMLAEMNTKLDSIQATSEENQRTLRGHNGTEGALTKIGRIEEQLGAANKAVESVKELSSTIKRFSDFPTLTWLVRHRFKEVVGITLFMVSMTLIMGAPALDGHVASSLTGLILRFVGALFGIG